MAKFRDKNTLDYAALKRELKTNGPGNLYLLWGPEDYLIADFVAALRDECVSPEMRDFDAKRLNGPVPDVQDVEEALDAMPFFGGRTFVELSGVDVNRCRDEKMAKLLADIPDWCTVVITLPGGQSPDGRLSLIKQIKKTPCRKILCEVKMKIVLFYPCLMEKEMATHSSVFAWRIPWTRGG